MAEALKDQFDTALVELLADRFTAVDPGFAAERFRSSVLAAIPDLELKDRVNLVADQLAAELPQYYPDAVRSVVTVADSGVEGFAAWPLSSFVERHGLGHPELSLEMMERLTRRWSCEFAIRPYLDAELELALGYLRRWVDHDDEAVRRLVSEGTRPRLPWGPKVQALLDDPEIGITLITPLRHDPSETVRRSVANHLNDVARAHPDRVVEIARQWSADPTPVDPVLIRHALRNLVKSGHPGALSVLGFTTEPEVAVESFRISPAAVSLGSHIQLETEITSTGHDAQRLVVDFVIHHVRADGSTSPKVFKWATVVLGPGETAALRRRRLIETASTRRYRAGVHRVELQIAGQIMAAGAFDLRDSSA